MSAMRTLLHRLDAVTGASLLADYVRCCRIGEIFRQGARFGGGRLL